MSRVFLGSSLGCCFGDIYVGEASGIIVDDDNTTTHHMQMKEDKYIIKSGNTGCCRNYIIQMI
jgi:hypothetical protein